MNGRRLRYGSNDAKNWQMSTHGKGCSRGFDLSSGWYCSSRGSSYVMVPKSIKRANCPQMDESRTKVCLPIWYSTFALGSACLWEVALVVCWNQGCRRMFSPCASLWYSLNLLCNTNNVPTTWMM